MEIIFLEIDEILEIHTRLIDLFGGELGVRDEGLLLSAIAQPSAGFGDQYLHRDLFEMAAAYVFHLIKNHPFVDGNKRIGWAAGIIFLEYNGLLFNPDPAVFDAFVIEMSVAEGKAGKPEITEFLKKYSRED